MENEPTFMGCMRKTTYHYYKEMLGFIGMFIIGTALIVLFAFACALLISKANIGLVMLIVVWLAITFMTTSSIVHEENITSIKGIAYSWVAANILLVVGTCGVSLIVTCNAAIPFIVAIGIYFIAFNIYGLGIATIVGTASILLTLPPVMAYIRCIKLWDWVVNCFRTTESLLYSWIKSV